MTAVAAAAAMQPGSSVRWRDLELAAFAAHPSVVRALDPRGRRSRAARSPMRIVRTVAIALVVLAPVWCLAFLGGGWFTSAQGDPGFDVPAAAVVAAIGLVVPGWLVWTVVRTPAQRRPSVAVIGAIYVAVGGVLAGLVVARAGTGQAIALPLVPFVATIGLGLVLVVLGGVFALRGGRTVAPRVAPGPLPAVRAAVARLDDAERAAVRTDLETAIIDLERRGVVGRGPAAAARRADLGLLALRMAQAPKG